jgi:hypothetical protein
MWLWLAMVGGAAAQPGLLEYVSSLDRPAEYKPVIDLNVDLMGCWSV